MLAPLKTLGTVPKSHEWRSQGFPMNWRGHDGQILFWLEYCTESDIITWIYFIFSFVVHWALSIQSRSHNSRLFKENNIDPLYCFLWSWASESGSNVHLLCLSHLFKWGSSVAYKIQKPPTAGEPFNDTIYIRFIFFPTLFIISFSLGLLC